MPRITIAVLCAALLAVLPACSSAGQVTGASAASAGTASEDSGTSESSSGADSTSTSDSTPPPETSGTEPARPPQGGQGSLTVASLPVGANVDGDGCLTIRFEGTASEVPSGIALVVTDFLFTPDVIKFGGSACPQETPVCRPGLVLTESGSDECFASITMDGAAVGTQAKVQVKAKVDCTGGQVAACVQFAEKVMNDHSDEGTFQVPEPNEPDTTPTDESPSPSPSESAAPSDSGATTSSS